VAAVVVAVPGTGSSTLSVSLSIRLSSLLLSIEVSLTRLFGALPMNPVDTTQPPSSSEELIESLARGELITCRLELGVWLNLDPPIAECSLPNEPLVTIEELWIGSGICRKWLNLFLAAVRIFLPEGRWSDLNGERCLS
jgi:hypothetical protein